MIERLTRDFENAWVLARDLPQVRAAARDERVRAIAALVERDYQYPVDSQVLAPDGRMLAHLCANDLTGEDSQYLKLLDVADRQ